MSRCARLLALIAAAACSSLSSSADSPGVAELSALRNARTALPRLSLATPYAPCASAASSASCREHGRRPTREHAALMKRYAAVVRDTLDPGALHGIALLNLLFNHDDLAALDSSVAYLRAVATLTSRPADALADLAAAELLRWEIEPDPAYLFAAVEAADSASSISVTPHAAATFNLALALQRLDLRNEAAAQWDRFAHLDPRSSWSREAERHSRASPPATPPPHPSPRDSAAIVTLAGRSPQAARVLGFDHWLPQWGAALLAGDTVNAEIYLAACGRLASTGAGSGHDRSLRDALAAIRAASAPRRRELATAHVGYGEGQRAAAKTDHALAARHFAEVLSRAPSEPLRVWASLARGVALVYVGSPDERDRVLSTLVAAGDTSPYSAAVARAHWARGTVLLRAGDYERAIEQYQAARSRFTRARELENAGATSYLLGESQLSMGARRDGLATLARAIGVLTPLGPSVWLHNALIVTSRYLEGEGLARAAHRLSDEDVQIASGLGAALALPAPPSIYLAEATVARARLLKRFQPESLAVNLARADTLLASAPAEFARPWVAAQLSYVHATMIAETRPAEAIERLDTALATFDPANAGPSRNAARYAAALAVRARAWVARGERDRAVRDLEAVLSLAASQHAAIAREGNRDALAAATRAVQDSIIVLRLASGDTLGALAIVERGLGRPEASARPRAAPGSRVVVWRAIGNVLLTWVVSDGGVELVRSSLDGATLRAAALRVRAALERRAGEGVVRADLSALYDALVRPVAARLGPTGTRVTVVPDAALAAIPFAALYDARASRYWVESAELRVESALADALGPAEPHAPGGPVLLVADPAVAAAARLRVPPLAHALAEVATIDSIYRGRARVLRHADANVAAVASALADARLVHFAGHAFSNSRDPEQSYLLLASSDSGSDGRFTAARIRALDLKRRPLVLLAACETLGSGPSIGYRGLAGALRAAGARAVVGSLWRVDDVATQELMVRFHAAYARDGDGPAALRRAQMQLLSSGFARLRSPAAWAAFQYTGS